MSSRASTVAPAEFLKGLEPVTKAIEELSKACLVASNGDVNALNAARTRVEQQWQALAERFASDPELAQARRTFARVRARLGDDFFYCRGNCSEAVIEYEASLAFDPDCMDALSGIVAVYVQGEDRKPEAALPYAMRRARLNPDKQADVEYIRGLMRTSR